ncbi:MAG: low molecular weight protein arginine phosphatase [Candidatus Latescibacterota bacterium]|nr:MAG: low molecular weight protein arginine phosphatase [Candidatus Latescibacterota bacterium]
MKKLLFVCSGNTCRSPLAEGIAKKLLPKELLNEIEISSAGSSALEGSPASSQAVRVAGNHSIDLTNHSSTLLNRTLVKDVNLIITMGSKHKKTVGVIEPTALDYTYLLTDFCDGEEGDIADPIGMGMGGYEETYEVLENCVRELMKKIESFDGWKK